MKNNKRTRAFRRHKKLSKLLKRINQWYTPSCDGDSLERFKMEVLKGKKYKFLRHTSTVCSCDLCSGPTYTRKSKHKKKRIQDEMDH